MAKKSLFEREIKRKKLVAFYVNNRKLILNSLKLVNSLDEMFSLSKKLQKLPRNSSKVRLRNRCFITGRPRGYFNFFGLSRNMIRELAHNCLLPGIIKASW